MCLVITMSKFLYFALLFIPIPCLIVRLGSHYQVLSRRKLFPGQHMCLGVKPYWEFPPNFYAFLMTPPFLQYIPSGRANRVNIIRSVSFRYEVNILLLRNCKTYYSVSHNTVHNVLYTIFHR